MNYMNIVEVTTGVIIAFILLITYEEVKTKLQDWNWKRKRRGK